MKAKQKQDQRTPQPTYDWRSGRYVVTGADGRRYSGDTAEMARAAARRGKGGVVMDGETEGQR